MHWSNDQPDRKGSIASTPKDGYEKVCATGQVAST